MARKDEDTSQKNIIQEILDSAASLDLGTVQEPQDEIEFQERLLGTIKSDFTKQLHGLSEIWCEELKKFIAGHSKEAVVSNSELKSHLLKLFKKLELLKKIFWFETIRELDLWDISLLGIRKGWKVVLASPEEEGIGGIIIGPFQSPF